MSRATRHLWRFAKREPTKPMAIAAAAFAIVFGTACGDSVRLVCGGTTADQCLALDGCLWNYSGGGCFTPCENDSDCSNADTCETVYIQTSPQEPGFGPRDACTSQAEDTD